jgi:hypothetical protein
MADSFYKIPLDDMVDKDLLDWIAEIPRNKKAEVIRHAIRFYISHLKDGELFYYTPPTLPNTNEVVESNVVKKKVGIKSTPTKGLKNLIKNVE